MLERPMPDGGPDGAPETRIPQTRLPAPAGQLSARLAVQAMDPDVPEPMDPPPGPDLPPFPDPHPDPDLPEPADPTLPDDPQPNPPPVWS